MHHSDRFDGVRIVGNKWSERSHETRMFLARNHVPYQWFELERDEEAARLPRCSAARSRRLPLVLLPDGRSLRGASMREVAEALGLRTAAEAAAVRPGRRRRRPGRARGRGVRGVGGAAHRGHRA